MSKNPFLYLYGYGDIKSPRPNQNSRKDDMVGPEGLEPSTTPL